EYSGSDLARIFVQQLVDAERCSFLPWWKCLECGKKLPDKLLHRHEQKGVVQQPIVIGVGSDVRSFVGVCAQVEDLRQAKSSKRLGPESQGSHCALFHKNKFKVVVPYSRQIAIIGKVYESWTGAFLFPPAQEWQQIVSVKMHFEGFVAGAMPLLEF